LHFSFSFYFIVHVFKKSLNFSFLFLEQNCGGNLKSRGVIYINLILMMKTPQLPRIFFLHNFLWEWLYWKENVFTCGLSIQLYEKLPFFEGDFLPLYASKPKSTDFKPSGVPKTLHQSCQCTSTTLVLIRVVILKFASWNFCGGFLRPQIIDIILRVWNL
jgi:hypothetical protein